MRGRKLPNDTGIGVDLTRIPELKLNVVATFVKVPMYDTPLKVGRGVCPNSAGRVLSD